MSDFKDMKFIVASPEQHVELVATLEGMGYEIVTGEFESHLPFVYAYSFKAVTSCGCVKIYNDKPHMEMDTEDFIRQQKIVNGLRAENMKFRINNPEESKAVQETLFQLGFEWTAWRTTLAYQNKPFLYADTEGMYISHSSGEDCYFFESSAETQNHKEIKVLPIVTTTYQFEAVEPPQAVQETIMVGGKVYNLEKLKERIKGLESVADNNN